MRSVIFTWVIAAMLFAGTEGAAEPVDESVFHQTHHVHADDGQQWYPDSVGGEHEHEECEHFCHAHVVALTPQASGAALAGVPGSPPTHVAQPVSRVPAPPIPPPNI